jgi:hypothetical protein
MKKNTEKFDIAQYNPCLTGKDYYDSKASFEEAWNECERGEWLLWISTKLEIDRRLLVKAAALCANTVRHLMEDKRSTDAIDACLRYTAGEIGERELIEYATAAYAAASYAAAAANAAANANANAAAAANAAANVVANANAAANANANAAAYAANAAAYAANAANVVANANAAAADNWRLTAEICREVLTDEVMRKVRAKNFSPQQ